MESPILMNQNYTGPTVVHDYYKKLKSHNSFAFMSKANKRYFILDLQKGMFYYKGTQHSDLFDATNIPLEEITYIYIDDKLHGSSTDLFWRYGFVIITKSKKYNLLAQSEQSRHKLLLAFSHLYNRTTQSYLYDPKLIRPMDGDILTPQKASEEQVPVKEEVATTDPLPNTIGAEEKQIDDLFSTLQTNLALKQRQIRSKSIKNLLTSRTGIDLEKQNNETNEIQPTEEPKDTVENRRNSTLLVKPAKRGRIIDKSIHLNSDTEDNQENNENNNANTGEKIDADSSVDISSSSHKGDYIQPQSLRVTKRQLTRSGKSKKSAKQSNQNSTPSVNDFDDNEGHDPNVLGIHEVDTRPYLRGKKGFRNINNFYNTMGGYKLFNLNIEETENKDKLDIPEFTPYERPSTTEKLSYAKEIETTDKLNKRYMGSNRKESTRPGSVQSQISSKENENFKANQSDDWDRELFPEDYAKPKASNSRRMSDDPFNKLQQELEAHKNDLNSTEEDEKIKKSNRKFSGHIHKEFIPNPYLQTVHNDWDDEL